MVIDERGNSNATFAQRDRSIEQVLGHRGCPSNFRSHCFDALAADIRCDWIDMSFLHPEFLWSALLLPIALLVVLVATRHVSIPTCDLARKVKGSRWKRSVCPVLLAAALMTIGLSLARPQAHLHLAPPRSTAMLTLDVSGSMGSKDILPSRLLASQTAARDFVDAAPGNMLIGVVVFSDTARLVVAPTLDRPILKAAIARLVAEGGTAIGDGLSLALAEISPSEAADRAVDVRRRSEQRTRPAIKTAWTVHPANPIEQSSAILLLTDGQNTDGTDPDDAAEMAAARGVRVFAIGFGTERGIVPGTGASIVRVPMNEHMLRRIAETTHAEYFHATTGLELREIYRKVEARITGSTAPQEMTAFFALAAALALAIAVLASARWFGQIL